MSNNFYVGQKVVCVDAQPDNGASFDLDETLVERHVYTISGFGKSHGYHSERCVTLVELTRAGGYGYRASRFRPAVSQFDFRKLVTPAELEKFQREDWFRWGLRCRYYAATIESVGGDSIDVKKRVTTSWNRRSSPPATPAPEGKPIT